MTRPVLRAAGDETLFEVRVVPRAARNEIRGWDDAGRLRVRVAAAPVDGAANGALVALLARRLGVAKNRLRVERGETSRQKTLAVRGMPLREVERALGGKDER